MVNSDPSYDRDEELVERIRGFSDLSASAGTASNASLVGGSAND